MSAALSQARKGKRSWPAPWPSCQKRQLSPQAPLPEDVCVFLCLYPPFFFSANTRSSASPPPAAVSRPGAPAGKDGPMTSSSRVTKTYSAVFLPQSPCCRYPHVHDRFSRLLCYRARVPAAVARARTIFNCHHPLWRFSASLWARGAPACYLPRKAGRRPRQTLATPLHDHQAVAPAVVLGGSRPPPESGCS